MPKSRRKRIFWKKWELDLLRRRYPHVRTDRLAMRLNRPINTVYQKALAIGLHRLSNPGNIKKGQRRGIAFEFKKGQIAWNKGRRGTHWSRQTEFKKGHLPANTLYDGAIRVRTDKDNDRPYKYIRLALGKWQELHRYRWEKYRGKIPKNRILVFRNGNTMNCRLRNLKLITREQHAANTRQKDGYIAKCLAMKKGGRGIIDRSLYRELLKHPDILDAKRKQLELNRTLREVA